MTFCLGLSVDGGVVALADTRIVAGHQVSSKFKLSELVVGDHAALVMTSGLRSVRDKVVARLEDDLASGRLQVRRLHELASAFGDTLRAVRDEDAESLEASGLTFNLNGILTGRLEGDDRPTVMHLYPEGNWVEAAPETPYVIIGRSPYGKPILDRLLRRETPLREALTLAYLAFDATAASVNDVGFPIDVGVLGVDDARFRRARLERSELDDARVWWNRRLGRAVSEFPVDWAHALLPPPEPTP